MSAPGAPEPAPAAVTTGAMGWCPFPNEDAALAAIGTLLREGLVACGNLIPGMTSVFAWQDEIQTAREVGVLFKTRADLLDRAASRLAQLHPYEEPAVLGWHCDTGAPQTLAWLSGLAPKI